MPKLGRPSSLNTDEALRHSDAVQRAAPYGTNYTPMVKTKIVGGKYVAVVEEDPSLTNSLTPLNVIHPLRNSRDFTRRPDNSESATVQQSSRSPAPPAPVGSSTAPWPNKSMLSCRCSYQEREDLLENDRRRQAAWSQRTVLPPISTSLPVRSSSPRGFSTYRLKPPAPAVLEHSSPHATPRNNLLDEDSAAHAEREYRIRRLCDVYLPSGGSGLSAQPLRLADEEELLLMRQCKVDLSHISNSDILKKVYLDMADLDPQLSGYIAFQDVLSILTLNKMFVSGPVLCLVASMFVSASRPGFVNYERILSFLGAAMKMTLDDVRRPTTVTAAPPAMPALPLEKPVYYQPDTSRSQNLSNEQSIDANLLRDLSESFRARPNSVNFEALRIAFQRADSLIRGTLSEQQIKLICAERGVPLNEDLIERAVRRCHHRGGGQYDWQQFLTLLERVQPQQTGLFIPHSKQPLDYVKPMPNPSPSWPHADNSSPLMGSPQYPAAPPAHMQFGAPAGDPMTPRYYDTQQVHQPQQHNYQQGEFDPGYGQPMDYNYNYNEEVQPPPMGSVGDRYFEPPQPPPIAPPANHSPSPQQWTQPKPSPIHQNHEISHAPPPARQGAPLPSNDPYLYEVEKESWLNRFMRLANALYREDRECRGTLPQETVMWLSKQYNDNFLLKLPEHTISNALNTCKRPNGRVDISAFLKLLSTKG